VALHRLDRVGAAVLGWLRYQYQLVALLYLCFKVVWTNRHFGQRDFLRQVFSQVYFTGVQAAGPVFTLALGVGAFAIVAGMGGFGALSGADAFGRIVTVVVLREVAPLLVGGIVIVRSVTAIAAELGVMRVQREIEAIEVMGLSPIRQLITPRVCGGLLSLFALNILFDTAALAGGFAISRFLVSLPAEVFFRAVFSAVRPIDIIGLAVKTVVGGLGLALIGCYHGMAVGRSPTEVPVAVSKASFHALVFLVVLDGGVSALMLLGTGASSVFGGVL
jgi:phospholipid/cholesterol/gamma-HCH transport system permease protein